MKCKKKKKPKVVKTKKETLKTLSNGGASHINKITLLEKIIKHKPLVSLKPIHRNQMKLLQMAHRNSTRFLQMTHLWLCELMVPDPSKPNLDYVVAISGLIFHLGHNANHTTSNLDH